MTTNQLTSGAAIAFAAFAAWYALKGRAAAASAEPSAADQLFGLARSQRREVGDALQQNVAFADDFTAQYAKRQGVPASNIVGGIDFGAAAYSFTPNYALG